MEKLLEFTNEYKELIKSLMEMSKEFGFADLSNTEEMAKFFNVVRAKTEFEIFWSVVFAVILFAITAFLAFLLVRMFGSYNRCTKKKKDTIFHTYLKYDRNECGLAVEKYDCAEPLATAVTILAVVAGVVFFIIQLCIIWENVVFLQDLSLWQTMM